MKTNSEKALIRYLHPGHSYLFWGIFLIFFCLISIGTVIFALLSLGCAILLIWLWSSANKKFKADLAGVKQAGKLDQLVSDFADSQPLLHKKVRLGQICLYGKKSGRIVYYRDIRRFYVHTNKGYKYPSCELNTSELVSLCQLRTSRSLDQYTSLMQIGNTIRSHNPNVIIDL